MLPDLDVSLHVGWIQPGSGLYSGIYINEHPGALTLADVTRARDAARGAAEDPETTTFNLSLIALVVATLLFAAKVGRAPAKERAARMQNVTLVKIPEKEGDEGPPPG